MMILSGAVGVVFIVLAHELAYHATLLILKLGPRVPATASASQAWIRSRTWQSQLAARSPVLFQFVRERLNPRLFTGLSLSLIIVAALYLIALFSGLTDEVLDAEGVVRFDNFVDAGLQPWRIEPWVSAFLWITALGSSPAVVAASIIATGFLWSQDRYRMIAALWVTSIGALTSTSIGKFLVGRHRPDSSLEIAATFSSFPSGHATAAMAVYGFLAFAIARDLPTVRQRFEVAYWTAVLIGMIGLSRIVLGVHFVTDVTGGFLVGAFWLLIGFTIAEWTSPLEAVPKDDAGG